MMDVSLELENLALGDVTLEEGVASLTALLGQLDESLAESLYAALRSWTWKALEARRRDDELAGWMELIGRVGANIREFSPNNAIKLEGFLELLYASVMTAAAATQRNPLDRKHVRDALVSIRQSGGRMRRADLLEMMALKKANLSRVMTPLQDDGYVAREVQGREIFYGLTLKGVEAVANVDVKYGSDPLQPDSRVSLFSESLVERFWELRSTLSKNVKELDIAVYNTDGFTKSAEFLAGEEFFDKFEPRYLVEPIYADNEFEEFEERVIAK
jgi:DNA-binding MarR family transcriptional regulator